MSERLGVEVALEGWPARHVAKQRWTWRAMVLSGRVNKRIVRALSPRASDAIGVSARTRR